MKTGTGSSSTVLGRPFVYTSKYANKIGVEKFVSLVLSTDLRSFWPEVEHMSYMTNDAKIQYLQKQCICECTLSVCS